MSDQINVDIAIIGGGIAGLWTLNLLKQFGFSAILLEKNKLGSGQTIHSQGIIHGGLKYALTGILNPAATAIRNMPKIWQDCLIGNGDLNLSQVKILSNKQYLFALNSISARLTNFLASKNMSSHVSKLEKSEYPETLQKNNLHSNIYALHEPVLDIPSLIQELAMPQISSCLKIDSIAAFTAGDPIMHLTIKQQEIKIQAKSYIFTAGEGNQSLSSAKMQTRPLHMVMLASNMLSDLYAHAIGANSTPHLTITTHTNMKSQPIWYVGGQLSELIQNTKEQQIALAQEELNKLFPWLNLSNATWDSIRINRAEHTTATNSRPNYPTIINEKNTITAWPTKLAFAPMLAQQIYNKIQQQNLKPQYLQPNLNGMPIPEIAAPPWHELICS